MVFFARSNADMDALVDKIHALEIKVFSDDKSLGAITADLDNETKKAKQSIENILFRLRALEEKEKAAPDSQIRARLDDLELWRAKITDLLVEKTPTTKRETLSRFGKRRLRGRV